VGRREEPTSRTASQEQGPPAAAVIRAGGGVEKMEEPTSRTASKEQGPPAASARAREGGKPTKEPESAKRMKAPRKKEIWKNNFIEEVLCNRFDKQKESSVMEEFFGR
jgi:hypothetical protein